MNIGIWAPLGPFGTLGPYLFSYLGPLWALLGPLALIFSGCWDILSHFGTLFKKVSQNWVLFRPTLFEKVDLP